MLGLGLAGQVYTLHVEATKAPQDFAALIEETIPPAAIIESWEWEIDALVQRTFHHPPTAVEEAAIAQAKQGQHHTYAYDWRAWGAEYLIVGPFAEQFRLYASEIEAGCCELLAKIGNYELYRVTP